jgi:hypothetical protein
VSPARARTEAGITTRPALSMVVFMPPIYHHIYHTATSDGYKPESSQQARSGTSHQREAGSSLRQAVRCFAASARPSRPDDRRRGHSAEHSLPLDLLSRADGRSSPSVASSPAKRSSALTAPSMSGIGSSASTEVTRGWPTSKRRLPGSELNSTLGEFGEE